MKLDISSFSFMSKNEYRVLVAIEMGMRNHEYLPVSLIAGIANLRKEGILAVLKKLLQNKLVSHENKIYDGYKLTYLGYDFLALRAFRNRGNLKSVGSKIGVGKESDIYICKDMNDNFLCLKIHRLGRISFRTIKNNRDYYGKKKFRNWLYLSKIAASKEYAYLKALYENNFPVPKPYDFNRHMIIMSYVNGYPLSHVKLRNPHKIANILLNTIVKFANADIIHGDFNEFNILIEDDEKVTIIDFPQIVSLHHENAKMYFERDVQCILDHFYRKYKLKMENFPHYEDIQALPTHHIVQLEENVSNENDHLLLKMLHTEKSSVYIDIAEEELNLVENESLVGVSLGRENDQKERHSEEDRGISRRNPPALDSRDEASHNDENPHNSYKGICENCTEKEENSKELEKREDEISRGIVDVGVKIIMQGERGAVLEAGLVANDSNCELGEEYEEVPNEGKQSEKKPSEGDSSKGESSEGSSCYEEECSGRCSPKGIVSASTNEYGESEETRYSSCGSEDNHSGEAMQKLSDTWKPHVKKYTKEYAQRKLKYMYQKKKKKEKYKENLKTKSKKKVMEKIKNYM
ncbi:serine/threonine protein kinase RIO2, putative [Plasmodium ovale]|uniref:Serine/threonine-protein kinase RIO2 n=2 Tax=Plasmodium ovale TaxID=36330 RepID=A0A1A8VPM9_PLAOA|nr:serine/threonine protein kinase RIO2, putative (RIO2) [Plasmodium ovale curtisi]SCA48716.1 serine/threonine protein kinase RIO2, putative [Plasmodium ovale]